MDINERIDKIEEKVEKIEDKIGKSIPEIQLGIAEIKAILKEKPIQEQLMNDILDKDIKALERRVAKIEDNLSWLWKTVAGAIITTIGAAIIFVIKIM